MALKTIDDKEKIVFEYKESDKMKYFGELALLNNDKRKASIKVTSEEMKVAYIERDGFNRLLGGLDTILRRNEEKYKKYEESQK